LKQKNCIDENKEITSTGERTYSTHKMEKKKYSQKGSMTRGRLKGKRRVKSLPKRQTHKHTNETIVQGRREKRNTEKQS
jgi:hypothetical protein